MDLANLTALFLSARGRISRKTFWIGAGLLIAWVFVIFVVLWTILGPTLIQNFFGRLTGFPFVLLTIYFAYNLAAKRFNDRDRPIICAQAVAGLAALKAVLNLVRITGDLHAQNVLDQLFVLAGTGIALWYFIELGMMRGTEGPNAHGEDPEAES
jgi:uncharacterized membrane protein YhaH (DUF805 family)